MDWARIWYRRQPSERSTSHTNDREPDRRLSRGGYPCTDGLSSSPHPESRLERMGQQECSSSSYWKQVPDVTRYQKQHVHSGYSSFSARQTKEKNEDLLTLEIEKLHTHEASHPEVSEYVRSLAVQCHIIRTVVEENEALKEENEALKQKLKNLKPDKEAKSTQTEDLAQNTSSTYDCIKEFSVQVHCTAPTFGADSTFFNKVCQNLKKQELHLKKEDYTAESDKLLLLFCPSISRTGTDIESALNSIRSGRLVILIVLHHIRNKDKTVYLNSNSLVSHRPILTVVDCQFFETCGLYDCSLNTVAVNDVSSAIWQHYCNKCL